jgi:hypothetical protein
MDETMPLKAETLFSECEALWKDADARATVQKL